MKRKRQASWGLGHCSGTVAGCMTGRQGIDGAAATEAPPVGGPAGGVGEWGMGNLQLLPAQAQASSRPSKRKLELWKQNKFFHQAAAGSPIKTPDRHLLVPRTMSSDGKPSLALVRGPPRNRRGLLARFRIIFLFPCFVVNTSRITDHGIRRLLHPSSHPSRSSHLLHSFPFLAELAEPIRERAPTSNRQRPSPSLRLSPSPNPQPRPTLPHHLSSPCVIRNYG